MEIEITKGAPEPDLDYDVVVLIDVFRATSTIACLLANGVEQISLASTFDEYDEVELEVGRTEYFSDTDHPRRTRDNSPISALSIDTSDVRRAVIVSRNGTKVPSWVNSCREFVVCSMLNVSAVAEHIRSLDPERVSIIAIGHIKVPEEAEEDNICAYTLRDMLEVRPTDEASIRKRLEARREETRNDPLAPQGIQIEMDRAICCGIALLDVVPCIYRTVNGYKVEACSKPLETVFFDKSASAVHAKSLGAELAAFHFSEPKALITNVDCVDYLGELHVEPRQDLKSQVPLITEIFGINSMRVRYPFHDGFGHGNVGCREIDLAFICAILLLSGDGSIHRARNLTGEFLSGYSERRGIDEKIDKDLFVGLIIGFLSKALNRAEGLPSFFMENQERLKRELSGIKSVSETSLTNLIRRLGDTSNNNGRLDGVVGAGKEFVYRKRDGREISVNPTNRCPNACVFCIRDLSASWKSSGAIGGTNLYLETEPTLEEIVAEVSNLLDVEDDTDGFLVKFCGYGEPLLRPDVICDASIEIKKRFPNVTIQVNTSGWPYYKDYCIGAGFDFKKFSDCGADAFSVSLNAPNKSLYDRLNRPGVYDAEDSAFSDTIRFLRESVENGFETKASVVAIPKLKKNDLEACENLVLETGAKFVVREFVGKRESIAQEKFGVEVEAKIFDVDRDDLLVRLQQLGANSLAQGLVRITVFDVPNDKEKRQELLETIKLNLPEHRSLFLVLNEIVRVIESGSTLADNLGFLRVMSDNVGARIVYRKPTLITSSSKREDEVIVSVGSFNDGIRLLEEIGLVPSRRQEKCRDSFEANDVRYHIDTWPGMKPYMEVEAIDDVAIYRGVSEIGLDPIRAKGAHAENIFHSLGIDPTELIFSDDELKRLGL